VGVGEEEDVEARAGERGRGLGWTAEHGWGAGLGVAVLGGERSLEVGDGDGVRVVGGVAETGADPGEDPVEAAIGSAVAGGPDDAAVEDEIAGGGEGDAAGGGGGVRGRVGGGVRGGGRGRVRGGG
jgi:hypothetical protein